MTNPSSNVDSFMLASRFLHAIQRLNKLLVDNNNLNRSFEDINVSQVRILQLVHDTPGIRADMVIESLELAKDTASRLILAMEKRGLLALTRSANGAPPLLQLGGEGKRLAFQIKATQLSILAELIGKLPETKQLVAVETVEQLVELGLE